MEIIEKPGNKSKNDIIYEMTCNNEAICFRNVAKIVARLAKNEQVLTNDITYYTAGAGLLKRYLDYIFEKNWVIIPGDKIDEELNLLYYKHFDKEVKQNGI